MKDVLVLGAGPVGLFAAFYATMRGQSVVIIDKLEKPGGQLSALYPEKYIYDVAGFDKIKAKDLVSNLEKQLKLFDKKVEFKLNQEVQNINKLEDGTFEVITSKEFLQVKSIIIAAGNGGFEARKLGVEDEDKKDIDYFIKDPEDYRDLDVVIFGGGDSAVDFSLMLENVSKSVSIVHRRDQFRAHEKSVEHLKESSVNIYTPYTPKEIQDKNGKKNVIIKSKEDEKEILVDKVICNFGFISKLGPIENMGIDLEGNKIKVDYTQKTNIDGIYAIGDICTYPGKVNLIITGFGEGPIAVSQIVGYLNPEQEVGVVHSSSLFEK